MLSFHQLSQSLRGLLLCSVVVLNMMLSACVMEDESGWEGAEDTDWYLVEDGEWPVDDLAVETDGPSTSAATETSGPSTSALTAGPSTSAATETSGPSTSAVY